MSRFTSTPHQRLTSPLFGTVGIVASDEAMCSRSLFGTHASQDQWRDPEHFGGKQFVLLIGYRHYYGSMVEWLERITNGFGSACHAIVCQTFDPQTGRDRPIDETPARLEEAYALGASLASSNPS